MFKEGQIINRKEHINFANWNNANGGKFISVSLGNGKFRIELQPTETLDELKAKKKEEINRARDKAKLTDSAVFNEDLFDIDQVSQNNILGMIQVSQLNPDESALYTYRSRTNINHKLTAKQLVELGVAIALKIQEIYQKSWELKAKVDKALTEEEINNINWEI